MITVPLENWIDVAVIADINGLEAFNAQYGVKISPDADLFDTKAIVVVFTQIWMGIEGVTLSRGNEFCVSVYDIGIDIEIAAPPPGRQYATIHPISLPKAVVGGRILIRQPTPATRADYGEGQSSNHGIEPTGDTRAGDLE